MTCAIAQLTVILQAWRIILPQLLLVALLLGVLTVSGIIFRKLDDKLANVPLQDIILFEFGTLTTIGWLVLFQIN